MHGDMSVWAGFSQHPEASVQPRDRCDVHQTPENKEEQDKHRGDYGPSRGGYRFTGRQNI